MATVSRDDAVTIARWQYAHMRELQQFGNPVVRALLIEDDWVANRVAEIMKRGATETEIENLSRLNAFTRR